MSSLVLRLHVFTEQDVDSGYYMREVALPAHLPAEGDVISLFDSMQLPDGDIGWPLGQVDDRLFIGPLLDRVEMHIDCPVQDSFFYDRPWRQHLLEQGWRQLECECQ